HKQYTENVAALVVSAFERHPSRQILVAAVQTLFRIGEVEAAVQLIGAHYELLVSEPVVFKILLLVTLIEQNYEYAFSLAKEMVGSPALIGDDPLALLMIVSAIHKCGGV